MILMRLQGLDVTMVSYMGKVRVAFKMEKGFIDPQKFNSCMETAYEMILEASAKGLIYYADELNTTASTIRF
jgi:predicted peroxiredoxin